VKNNFFAPVFTARNFSVMVYRRTKRRFAMLWTFTGLFTARILRSKNWGKEHKSSKLTDTIPKKG